MRYSKRITAGAIAVFTLLSLPVFAQKSPLQHRLDSLERQVSNIPEDSTKILLLETLSLEYSGVSPDKGLQFAWQAYELSKKLGLKNREAASLTMIANGYSAKGEFRRGIEYNKQAETIYRSLKNASGIAAVNSNQSQIYIKIGNYEEALACNFTALKIYENNREYRNRAIVLENIADIYYQLKKYPKSKNAYRQSLQLYKSYGSKEDIARCLGNMSRVYMDTEEYHTALKQLDEALRINRRSGNKGDVLINLANIGLVNLKMYRFEASLDNLNRSLKLSEELDFTEFIAVNKGNIGIYYSERYKHGGQHDRRLLDSSVVYLTAALRLCDEIGFTAPKVEFMGELIGTYVLRKDYRQAYELSLEKAVLSDSLSKLSSEERITSLETARELDLKDKDIIIKSRELRIETLKSQRNTFVYTLGIVTLLVLFVVVFRYMRRKNRKQTAFISEIKQVQSHDIRGPVATILGLSKLLRKETRTDDSRRELIEGIEKMSQQLNEVLMKVVSDSRKLEPKNRNR